MEVSFAAREIGLPTDSNLEPEVSSPLNDHARRLLDEGIGCMWGEALDELLSLHMRSQMVLNALEPRIPCYLHEFAPPASFAEVLRRVFAPDLRVRRLIRCVVSSTVAETKQAPEFLEEWQTAVLDPFAEYLGRSRK